jgi:hypothetical protein
LPLQRLNVLLKVCHIEFFLRHDTAQSGSKQSWF